MSVETGVWGVVFLFVLLALRIPVALALIAVSFSGVAILLSLAPAVGILANTPCSFVANWTLSAVPMFLLMGFVAYHSGMTGGLFDAVKSVLRRVPGAGRSRHSLGLRLFGLRCRLRLVAGDGCGDGADCCARDGAGRIFSVLRHRGHRVWRHDRRVDPAI